jgi:hypothetical protein
MTNIADHRLHNQRLSANKFDNAEDVVNWLGAVQAQDYPGAKWALAQRMTGATDAALDAAFAEGRILRTHVMRPTWHFVTPADIRWILELTAPRVNAVNAYMYRQLELDDALFLRSNAVLTKALQGGKQLTRNELASELAKAGISADKIRLGYIVHRAELDGVVCSGPRRGKQFTYMLLDERAPQARILKRDEALAELTRRYFTSHGPATVHDFAWWSGLTIADTKAGLEMVGSQLTQETIDGNTYWFSESTTPPKATEPEALLLSTYDEFVIGYTDRSALFETEPPQTEGARTNIVFDSMIVMGSHIVGSWRRSFSKGAVVIETAPFRPFTAAENEAFTAATQRYGDFLGVPVVLA